MSQSSSCGRISGRMDNVTHTMSGLILTRMGLGAGSGAGTVALVLSSNLPDVDVLIQMAGGFQRDHLFSHRGVTHGLAVIPLEAAIVATAIWALTRWRSHAPPALSWVKLALLSVLGLFCHLALDFSNEYGVRMFAPFDSSWYSSDLTGLLDFWMLITLALGVMLPTLFRHMTSSRFPARVATFSLVLVIAYLGVKYFSHAGAIARLEKLARPSGSVRIACFPGSLNPFTWKGVIEDHRRTQLLEVSVSARPPIRRQQFENACPGNVRAASMRSAEVRALLSFARFAHFEAQPWTTDRGGHGYKVQLTDLRWQSNKGYNNGPHVTLWLDERLAIVKEEVIRWS